MSDDVETAILAGGCFWGIQELLRHRDGVIATRVGYTGGDNDHPTEEDPGGHAEAVEVLFDPERISYRDILGRTGSCHTARPPPDAGRREPRRRPSPSAALDEYRQPDGSGRGAVAAPRHPGSPIVLAGVVVLHDAGRRGVHR
jgi:hypothetical protein